MTAAWFISDLHLKDINERSGNILLRFLHSLASRERPVTHLFLLGDIFDLWVGDSEYFYRRFQPVVDTLLQLRRQGIEIHFFEGNHDMHLAQFWEKELGIPCWVTAKYFQVGDLLLRLEHGDLMNLEDKAYLKFRKFMRQPAIEKLAQILPGFAIGAIGDWASRKSRQYSSVERQNKQSALREVIRAHAIRSYSEAKFDAIISGHMHVVDDVELSVNGHTFRSINLGSWFQDPVALSLIDGQFKWEPLA